MVQNELKTMKHDISFNFKSNGRDWELSRCCLSFEARLLILNSYVVTAVNLACVAGLQFRWSYMDSTHPAERRLSTHATHSHTLKGLLAS